MTDLLLINPPSTTEQNYPIPFGTTYLASFLEKNNFSIKILDLSVRNMKDNEILKYIGKIKPKKVGISCMSVHVKFADNLSKKIKQNFKKTQVILGGIHPTALPEQSVKYFKYVDLFVIGEGELTALEIMQGKKPESIKGLAYMKNKKVKINPPREFIENLDMLPFPARHLLPDIKNYKLGFDWEGRTPSATLFSSRGCPFNCIYCASKVMWKRKVRFISAKKVLEEIDLLVNKYGIKEILFYDDHFTLNKKRLYNVCNELIKRKYNLTWCCLSRVDNIDFRTAKLMKKSGCHMINFGVESGSQTILDSMEKNVRVEDIIKAFEICKKVGINTKATFIFGAPKETYSTIKETQNFLKIILPDYVWFFIMTPMPGTKLYKLHEKLGINSTEWSMYDQTTYNKFYGTNLNYNQLRKVVADTYKSYYLHPKYIFSQIKKFNFRKISVYLKLFKRFFFIIKYIKRGRPKNEKKNRRIP
jgi:radical SAM superfamily enzyme YgiQ (UPF0313 family)